MGRFKHNAYFVVTSPNVGDSGNTGSSGGVTGNRLDIHLNEGKVALPAVITDGNYQPLHDEEIMVMATPAPTLWPFSMLGRHGTSKSRGLFKESTDSVKAPPNNIYVMTRRFHTGDENGSTRSYFNKVAVDIGSVTFNSMGSPHGTRPNQGKSFSFQLPR